MKCRDCGSCHTEELVKWNPLVLKFENVTIYQCWGVPEPFEISDLDVECPAYPKKDECKFCHGGIYGGIFSFVKRCSPEISVHKLYCPVCGKELKR